MAVPAARARPLSTAPLRNHNSPAMHPQGSPHVADPPHPLTAGGRRMARRWARPLSTAPPRNHNTGRPSQQAHLPPVADPPHTAHGGGPAHGGPRSMGPSSQHRASPQPQHGAPGVHQTQGSPHVADPPPPPHTAPSQQQPAPAVTAEEVKRRLTQAGVEGWQAFTAADKDPQRVADILDRAGGLSPGAIFNRIVRPGA